MKQIIASVNMGAITLIINLIRGVCNCDANQLPGNLILQKIIKPANIGILIAYIRVLYLLVKCGRLLLTPLCNGKLTNACGFGGLFNAHSKLL